MLNSSYVSTSLAAKFKFQKADIEGLNSPLADIHWDLMPNLLRYKQALLTLVRFYLSRFLVSPVPCPNLCSLTTLIMFIIEINKNLHLELGARKKGETYGNYVI